MTDRSLIRRLVPLTALVALLLGSSGDVYGYHECPHHSVPAAPAAHDRGAPEHETDAHGADTHGPHADGPPSHGEDAPPSHGEGSGPCTCLGMCSLSATAPQPSASPADLLPGAADARTRSVPAASAEPTRQLVGLLLPYPNGPPTS